MKLTLNLASRSYVNTRALLAAYAACLLALVLLLAFQGYRAWRLHEHAGRIRLHQAEVETRLGSLRESGRPQVTAAALERQRAEVEFANEILERDSFRWTALLDRLEEVTVDGVSVHSLTPDPKKGSIQLTAQARSIREMQEFLDQLAAYPAFAEVYLLRQSAGKVKAPGGTERPVVAFTLSLQGGF